MARSCDLGVNICSVTSPVKSEILSAQLQSWADTTHRPLTEDELYVCDPSYVNSYKNVFSITTKLEAGKFWKRRRMCPTIGYCEGEGPTSSCIGQILMRQLTNDTSESLRRSSRSRVGCSWIRRRSKLRSEEELNKNSKSRRTKREQGLLNVESALWS